MQLDSRAELQVRTMVLWKQSRLGPAKPSADFRGSVHVHPSVWGDDGGRPGVVAAHSIDLSDGSLDIDGGESPERLLGGCLLLQIPLPLPPLPLDASVAVYCTYWLSLPYLSSSIGTRGREGGCLELLKWGEMGKGEPWKGWIRGDRDLRCPVVIPKDSSSLRARDWLHPLPLLSLSSSPPFLFVRTLVFPLRRFRFEPAMLPQCERRDVNRSKLNTSRFWTLN